MYLWLTNKKIDIDSLKTFAEDESRINAFVTLAGL